MRFFVELVGHYPLHMVESSNGTKELQRDSFRKSHPSRGVRQFLQLFMETQMFAGFIQDKELRKAGGRGQRALRRVEILVKKISRVDGKVIRKFNSGGTFDAERWLCRFELQFL